MKSNDRDAPDVLPVISPSSDAIAGRRISRRPTPRGGPKKSAGTSWRLPFRVALPGVVPLVLLIAILGAGGAIWLLQGTIEQLQAQLAIVTQQLQHVSGAVSATGDSVSRNEEHVGERIKALDFEVRKLWDLANKRNRSRITQQAQQLDTLRGNLAASTTQLKQQGQALDKSRAEADRLARAVTDLKKDMAAVRAELVAGSATDNAQLLALEKSINALSDKVSQHGASKDGLSELRERMDSVDGYRQQASRRLQQLEQGLRSLQAKTASGG